MKPNKAPEKIYILPHKDYSDKRIMNAFTEKEGSDDIEYIRKDAFIEKACEWLRKELCDYFDAPRGDYDMFVEDFRNYMKGE